MPLKVHSSLHQAMCLRCCECLCTKNYTIQTRVQACYPTDNRPTPILARVRELITWGNHDLQRVATIHQVVSERIRADVASRNFNRVSVGVNILYSLIERIRDLNLNLANTLTDSILLLISTQDAQYIQLASEASSVLIKHTQRVTLPTHVQRIIQSYLPLCSNPELIDTALNSISSIIDASSLNWIPLLDILTIFKDNYINNNSARNVLKSIAHSVSTLDNSLFARNLFQFFDDQHLWNDMAFLNTTIQTLLSEMQKNVRPLFFRSWLEQLPPKTADNGHCRAIISVSSELFTQMPNLRLVSQTGDSLSMIFLFVIQLPGLAYDDREQIIENSIQLAEMMVNQVITQMPGQDIVFICKTMWDMLPNGDDKAQQYDADKAALIFRFMQAFNTSAEVGTDFVNTAMKAILKFLVYYDHQESILETVMQYFRSLYQAIPNSRKGAVIPLLLQLQSSIKPDNLRLHSFIMINLLEAVSEGCSDEERSYVKQVCKNRFRSTPPQIDPTLNFVIKAFPNAAQMQYSPETIVTFLFDQKKFDVSDEEKKILDLKSQSEISITGDDEEDQTDEQDDTVILPQIHNHKSLTNYLDESSQSEQVEIAEKFEDAIKQIRDKMEEADNFLEEICGD